MNAGATPKFTASASESISSPIFDVRIEHAGGAPVEGVEDGRAREQRHRLSGLSSSANFTADSPRQMAATVIALGRIRMLICGGLMSGSHRDSSASTVSPPIAR